MDYCDVSCQLFELILTAPIHSRRFMSEYINDEEPNSSISWL